MNISARNQFTGTVATLVTGPINAEVTIALDGGQEIVAVVTKNAVERLGLKEGGSVTALVKASNVLLATE